MRNLELEIPEPVGVWRTWQCHDDLLACQDKPGRRGSAGRLSAALIVRDEQHNLPRCLASIRDLVDEIVVVDTGSIDRTKEVARSFGARVFDFPWNDSFADARNEAARRVRGDWILTIDADETAGAFAREELRNLLADESKAAYYVRFRRRRRLTQNWQLKLYRNHPDLSHSGFIHEAITPSALRAATGQALGWCDLSIDHSGYNGDLHHKHARNLPLLYRALETEPGHPNKAHIWGHVADIHEALGRPEFAAAARRRAVELVRQKGRPHPCDCGVYLALLTQRFLGGVQVGELLHEALALFPDNLQLLWIEGRYLMQQACYAAAGQRFATIIERGRSGNYSGWVGYDHRLFDMLAPAALAECQANA